MAQTPKGFTSHTTQQLRFIERYRDMLWNDPENKDQVGPGTAFPTPESLLRELEKVNATKPWIGAVCDDKVEKGKLVTSHTLNVPNALHFSEQLRAECRPVRTIKHEPTPAPAEPEPQPMLTMAPPPQPRSVREVGMTEFVRQSTPSEDGANWRPGSEMQALEMYARSGVNPAFTKEYYALKSVAARQPVVTANNSGQVGSTVNGNITSDHLLEGSHLIGENKESHVDDGAKSRHAMTGRKGLIGEALTGPRQRGRVNGEIASITADGTMQRDEHMKLQFAHGGNYAFTLLGATIPTGNMLGLPVGALDVSPQKQAVLPAEARRWGIVQAVNVMSTLNEAGYDTMFRDEQSKITSPFETPDRIKARMYRDNATNVFVDAMRAVDDPKTDPATKAAAAETALVAWRDFRQNALTQRVDALRVPLGEATIGIENHFRELGLPVDQIVARAATAPQLNVVDMPKPLLESLQDYKGLKDDRYQGITPGQTNPAYESARPSAYRTMNLFEQELARGQAPELKEKDMAASARGTAQAVIANPASVVAFGQIVERNPSVALQTGMLIADIKKNYGNYGLSRAEAKAFSDALVADDKSANKEVSRRGDTTPLPVLGRDQPYANARPEVLGAVVGRTIQAHPELGARLLDLATNPELGVDKKGRSDGRRYGIGIFRELGAEMLPAGAPVGALPPAYAHLNATLDAAGQAKLHDTTLAAVSYGEAGASGRSVRAVQRLDNLYSAAQAGQLEATGRGNYDVVTEGPNKQAQLAAIAAGSGPRQVTALNTGVFDGRDALNAGRSGDTGQVFNTLVRSQEARETGSDRVAVLGMRAHPAIARDAMLLTLLREPHALDGAIKELRHLDSSTRGDRYGELASALEKTRAAAEKFKASGNENDRNDAVRSYGAFFTNTAATDTARVGALRITAWNGFINAVGQNADASAWVMDTVGYDAGLRNAVLATVPDTIGATDGARHSSTPKVPGKGEHAAPTINGDDAYQSRFFTLPTDEKGKVQGNGFLGIGRHKVGINDTALDASLGALPNGVNAGTVAEAARGLSGVTAGYALNTNPVIVLGANNTSQTPVAALAAWMQASGYPAPQGLSYTQLANASLEAGLVKVTTDAGKLVATPNSENIDATLVAAANLSAAPGVAKWWALGFLKHHHGKTDEPLIPGTVPGCLAIGTIPRPGDAPGTVCPSTPITVVPGR